MPHELTAKTKQNRAFSNKKVLKNLRVFKKKINAQ